jgi:GT2 family glycosyltransferase
VPPEIDYKFFLGRGPKRKKAADEVILDVGDNYNDLPLKTVAMCEWALKNGYDYLCKVDDDVYLRPERILTSDFEGKDYIGRLRGPSGKFSAPYCSGFTYILSRKAMEIIVGSVPTDNAEDRFIGNTLYAAGIVATPDYRFVVIKSNRNANSGTEGPREGNLIISAGEFVPKDMLKIHNEFLTLKSNVKSLSIDGKFQNVSVLVKTFLRDPHALLTIQEIESFLPGAKIIIVDDGYESKDKIELYSKLRLRGHSCLWMEFDSGFCAKSNIGVASLDRQYLLIASDDFEFNPKVSEGVAKLIDVLDSDPSVGVASGTVDGNNYQGLIERGEGYIKEIPLVPKGVCRTPSGTKYDYCDITVNYCLVRQEVFESGRVAWDEEYKIGGDHFEFFDQVRSEGWKVAIVSGVNINQRKYKSAMEHPQYRKYRGRARQSLPRFFEKYNITRYIAFDGREDVLTESGEVVSKAPTKSSILISATKLHKSVKVTSRGTFVTTERLYRTPSGEIVTAGHPDRQKLFAAKGIGIPIEMAEKYGLVGGKDG